MVNCARKETGIERQSALWMDGLAIIRAVIPSTRSRVSTRGRRADERASERRREEKEEKEEENMW